MILVTKKVKLVLIIWLYLFMGVAEPLPKDSTAIFAAGVDYCTYEVEDKDVYWCLFSYNFHFNSET